MVMILVMKGALQVVSGDPYLLPRQSSTQTDKTQTNQMNHKPHENSPQILLFTCFGPIEHELLTQVCLKRSHLSSN